MQVLTALAAAQSLGFRHWDLRLKNIMEHTGAPTARRVTHMQPAHAHVSAVESVCSMALGRALQR